MNAEVEDYFKALAAPRRERLASLLDRFREAIPEAEVTMRYRMPALERGDQWVSLGNQKHYIAIYFCDEAAMAPLVAARPDLDCGKGCARIRDTQAVPEEALVAAFRSVMDVD